MYSRPRRQFIGKEVAPPPTTAISRETVLAWREASDTVFSDLAVIKLWDGSREASVDLVLGDRAERLRAGIVTSNFFRVLGVSAAIAGSSHQRMRLPGPRTSSSSATISGTERSAVIPPSSGARSC